jgi:hypothetical protein
MPMRKLVNIYQFHKLLYKLCKKVIETGKYLPLSIGLYLLYKKKEKRRRRKRYERE